MKKFKPVRESSLRFCRHGARPSPFWDAAKALNPGYAIPVPEKMSRRSVRTYASMLGRTHGIVLSCRMSVNGVYYVINMGKKKVAL